uniref:Uncharacterized protein n=1 Tax=Myoviridae sp. ctvns3 TaxID=2825204 RepID=A0A8S5PDS7_9CAUD|nr:MAG TPA: hypothetical protein [Myoviridae sp. ctvns3]
MVIMARPVLGVLFLLPAMEQIATHLCRTDRSKNLEERG